MFIKRISKNQLNVKCYFLTGTGRCGTKLFSVLLSMADNSLCEHEKIFRHKSMLRLYLNNDFSYYLKDINSHLIPKVKSFNNTNKSYGISSGHMYFSIPYLYSIFGESVRFILLVRRPEEFVRSALARGFFDSNHPHSCIQILPNKQDAMFEKWDRLSPFEKNLWYWKLVNEFVVNEFNKLPKNIYKIIKIEDINPALIRELCDFLELKTIKDKEINKTLVQRVNASPGLGDESDLNPWSLPLPLRPVEEWDDFQLGLLDQYTNQLVSKIY